MTKHKNTQAFLFHILSKDKKKLFHLNLHFLLSALKCKLIELNVALFSLLVKVKHVEIIQLFQKSI